MEECQQQKSLLSNSYQLKSCLGAGSSNSWSVKAKKKDNLCYSTYPVPVNKELLYLGERAILEMQQFRLAVVWQRSVSLGIACSNGVRARRGQVLLPMEGAYPSQGVERSVRVHRGSDQTLQETQSRLSSVALEPSIRSLSCLVARLGIGN